MSKIDYKKFDELLEEFNKETNAEKKLQLSVEMAKVAGVPEKEILHNVDEIDAYFKS